MVQKRYFDRSNEIIIGISGVNISLLGSDRSTVQQSLNNNSMSTKIYHASRLRGEVCKLVCHNSAAETVRNFMGTGVYPIHRSTLSSAYFVGNAISIVKQAIILTV